MAADSGEPTQRLGASAPIDRWDLTLVVGIVLLGAVLRFWNPAEVPPGMWEDEAIHARWAREVGKDRGISLLWHWLPNSCGLSGPLHLQNEWIVHYTGAVFDRLWPSLPPVSIRRASALWGTLAIIPLFFVVRILYGRWPAAMSAALFAVARWPVLASHVGFRANALPFFILMIFLTGLLATRRKSILWALVCGLLIGLSYYSYLPAKGIPLGILLWLGILRLTGTRMTWSRPMVVACVAGYLVFLIPAGIQATRETTVVPSRVASVSVLSEEGGLQKVAVNVVRVPLALFWNGDLNPRHNLPPAIGRKTGRAGLEWWTALLFALGFWVAARKWKEPVPLLLILFVGLMCVPSIVTKESPHFLRMAGILAPAYVLVGRGAGVVGEFVMNRSSSSTRRLLAGFYVAVVVFAGASTVRQVLVQWPSRIETWWAFSGSYYEMGNYVRQLDATTAVGVGKIPYYSETFRLLADLNPGKAKVYPGYVPDDSWKVRRPLVLIAANDEDVRQISRLYPAAHVEKEFFAPNGGRVGVAIAVR